MSSPRPALLHRITTTACVAGPYRLSDGRVLDAYFDEYALAADPALLSDVAEALARLVPDRAEVLAGVELGGVPLVVALSAVTGLPATFLRRTAKRYGTGRQIEGHPVEGSGVVLVDDVVRSGGQLLAMTAALRACGASVVGAVCVLERPLGGRANLAVAGVDLAALFGEADLADPVAARAEAPR
jgi:orotate phosphoribosyltransferase